MNLRRLTRPLAAAAVAALAVNLWLALRVAPEAAGFSAPITQRIFYVHVPAFTAAYAGFAVALLGCLLYLARRDAAWDRLAACSAEVSVVLTTIALGTGVVWSRVEFFSVGELQGQGFAFALLGDPKFVTTAALWLVFLGYLALRRSVEGEEQRARLASVYGVLGFLAVPLSYLSSRFSPHPDFLSRGSELAPGMALLLFVSMGLWLLIYAALLANRLALEPAPASDGAPQRAAQAAEEPA